MATMRWGPGCNFVLSAKFNMISLLLRCALVFMW